MNRIVRINNLIHPISTKQIEFKTNHLYKNNEILPINHFPNTQKICRICLEDDDEEYISPCLCKGTQKYIHRECLNRWRNMHPHDSEKKNSCEICKYEFKFYNRDKTDYSKYLIKINYIYIIRSMFTWFTSMMFIWIELTSDFFIIRTLNFYNYNNSKLLIIFRQPSSNNIYYTNYILFYLPLSFFILEMYYVINFYLQCYKIFKNTDYKFIMNCYTNKYICQSFLFLYYYYSFLIINDLPFTYIYSNCFTIIFNIFYRLSFYKKHNEVISDIIYEKNFNEEILSFEYNPLLNTQYNEITEKKAQDINILENRYISNELASDNIMSEYSDVNSSYTSESSAHSNETFFNHGETKNDDNTGIMNICNFNTIS